MQEELAKARVPRIDPSIARDLLARRAGVVFVDVRSPEAYELAHIPGAVSMPLPEIPHRYHELPRDEQQVLY